ncbi:MAG: XdhC family aldehyde oxidoreductase maturation factor [Pseudomonadota bacterium]
MDPIVSAACELLSEGKAFVLATITSQQGSTPRTAGTRMLITAAQAIFGTIGGGLLEARTMQAAAVMTDAAPARFLSFDLTNHEAAAMEMICGGRVEVLLDYIGPTEENRALFTGWRAALSQGRKAMLVSVVVGSKTQIERIDHALLGDDGGVLGALECSSEVKAQLSSLAATSVGVQVLNLEGRLWVAHPGDIAPTIYLFGAGHVARPTAHLAAMVGFSVVVLDDRPDFADAGRFPDAAAVKTLPSFDAAFEGLEVTDDTYIIIVTRGHLHDRDVLAKALKTPAAYIGMIGSRRKRDTIYESLLKDGYTAGDIARVHSPIGLAIGADSPEEIAVSIVAELIAVRAGINT